MFLCILIIKIKNTLKKYEKAYTGENENWNKGWRYND